MHRVIVIGAGIAGASCAYFLAQRGVRDVLLLERESVLAFHSTGRSAAVVHALVDDPVLRRLILDGATFLRNPPAGFSEYPVLTMEGSLTLFSQSEWPRVHDEADIYAREGLVLELLSPEQTRQRVPVLVPGAFAGAAFAPQDGNVDVQQLLSSFLSAARHAGAEVRTDSEVTSLLVEEGRCVGVRANGEEHRADWVVNASGAWASRIAAQAGALDINIQPHRRSAVTFKPPPDLVTAGWPLVAFDSRRVYFKPESGRLMMSPMDADPIDPCDPRPSDLRIAEGMERLRALAPVIVPSALEHRWAGLRSFAPDLRPVVGEDPRVSGFFWLAGQGGVGIETSPALGAIAADLIVDGKTRYRDYAALDPRRFG